MTKYRYYFPIQVRFADTDAQGHVFFANYLTYCDEAMSGYLQEIGYSWQKMLEMGFDIFYVDVNCQYKRPATFGDMLHVHATVARIGNSSFTMDFAIYKREEEQLLATSSFTIVMADKETHKPQRVPDDVREAVEVYEGEGK